MHFITNMFKNEVSLEMPVIGQICGSTGRKLKI